MPAVRPSLQAVFTLLLGPFAFFNAQKTKYLQMLTSLMRWMGKNKPAFLSSIWSKIILLQTGFPAFHLSLFVLFAFFSFSSSLLFSSIHMHFPCPPPPRFIPLPRVAAGSGPSIMVWSCSLPLPPVSSFLSLAGLTDGPEPDWTVSQGETGQNEPASRCGNHSWITAPTAR